MITNELIHIFSYSPLSFITYLVLGHILDVPKLIWFSFIMTLIHVVFHGLYLCAVIADISWADPMRTILQLSVDLIIPLFFSRRKLSHTVLGSTLTMLAATMAEGTALFTYSAFGGSFDSHVMTDPFSNTPAYMMMYAMNLSFILFFLWLVWYLWNRFVLRSHPKAAWFFMLFPLSQVIWLTVAEIYAITSRMPTSRYLYFIPAILFSILADWLVFRSIRTISRQAADEERSVWYRELLDHQENYYSYILADQEEASHIRHDIRNQLQTVVALMQSGDSNAAQSQLGELKRITDQSQVFCENRIVNAILHVKQLQFRDQGIRLECRCNIPDDLPVTGVDLCSLFSNLLDNAANGVKNLPTTIRNISLSSDWNGQILTVRCENAYPDDAPLRPSYRRDGHGLGLTILEDIASRYHGEMKVDASSGIFIVTIWFVL